jgi:hypothetical protein
VRTLSLRARILAGAVLWSLGLFVAVSFLLSRPASPSSA